MTETGYYGPEDTGEGESTTGKVADRAKETASQVTGQAQEKASQVAGQVRGQASDQVRQQVDQRSTQAGEQLSSFATAFRRTGDNLRGEGQDAPARMTEAVAERVERIGNYLRDSDADRILGDVEDFARRQPWLAAGGGFLLGLVGSRFVKASSTRRYEARYRPLPARREDMYVDVTPPVTTDVDYVTPPVTGVGPAIGDVPPVVDEPGLRP